MKDDARLYIAKALIELMNKKSFDSIKINEICNRAGISRMTYYRHFQDKIDILYFYMKTIFDEYMTTYEASSPFSFMSHEHIRDSLIYFAKHKDFALCLFNCGMSTIMLSYVNEYIKLQPSFNKDNIYHSYPLYVYAGALYNTYIQWLLDDMSTPADTIANIIKKALYTLN